MRLISLIESISNGSTVEWLDVLSVFSICAGITVITTKNPIESLIWLIGLFGLISIYLILCGFTFIGFSYLIVYIGAVSILFLFILMLINIRSSELQSNNSNSIALGLFVVLITNYIIFEILPYSLATLNNSLQKFISIFNMGSMQVQDYKEKFLLIWNVVSNGWENYIFETSHISAIGNILYTSYNIWLFKASFILLLAMVGAIVITINNKKELYK